MHRFIPGQYKTPLSASKTYSFEQIKLQLQGHLDRRLMKAAIERFEASQSLVTKSVSPQIGYLYQLSDRVAEFIDP